MTDQKCMAGYPDLEGKSVLITGAAAGLGRTIALAFARQGSRMILADIDREGLGAACRDISDLGADVIRSHGSVTSEEDLDSLFAKSREAFGAVDILVNNAGISAVAPTIELSGETWQQALDVNLTGPLLCAQRAAPEMASRGGGVIVNMSSIYGIVAAPERAAYSGTKSALAMLTKVMAVEWASKGVRANALAPSYVQSEFVQRLAADGKLDLEKIEQRTPIGRLVTQEEVANLALFLSSDVSSAITGQVIAVDGGWTAYGYV